LTVAKNDFAVGDLRTAFATPQVNPDQLSATSTTAWAKACGASAKEAAAPLVNFFRHPDASHG
jgi:hypothetical protein